MRAARVTLALALTAAAAAAVGAAAAEPPGSGGDPALGVTGESLVSTAEPLTQRHLHTVTDAVQDWAESGLPGSGGYAGTVIDAAEGRARVYWKGDVPGEIRELVQRLTPPGLAVDLRSGPYSRAEMTAAVDRFTAAAAPDSWSSVGPNEDGSGITVTGPPAGPGDRSAERASAVAGLPVTLRPGGPALPLAGSRGGDDSPYYAGAQVRTDKAAFCSTAFTGWKGSARVVLTAAHCGPGRYYNGSDRYVGDRIAAHQAFDIGLIGVNGEGSGRVYDGGWADGRGSSRRVYGPGRNNVGDLVCLSGAQTGWICDVRVTAVDVRAKGADGAVIRPVDVAESRGGDHRAIVAKGDSGGPVLANPYGPEQDMEARGVVVAGGSATTVPCPPRSTATPTTCYWQVLYVPMTPIVRETGFTLS
ncbi:hypothetical protein ACIRBX_00375 [Kitasatospora sp. NPDC096147]|uniref:hypothetical protein n=1 Tax=Kitasatospora sp. NPDC096147 TaxID=3364093 RepID=UPI00382867CE